MRNRLLLASKDIGEIDSLMLANISGHARYARVGFCGFRRRRPPPWSSLNYDREREGYVANVTERLLEAALEFSDDSRTASGPKEGERPVRPS